MQDRHSPQTRKSLLATHGQTIHVGHTRSFGDVGSMSGLPVAAPTAGIGTKGRGLECRRCKVPASGGEGHKDPVSAEADDVGLAGSYTARCVLVILSIEGRRTPIERAGQGHPWGSHLLTGRRPSKPEPKRVLLSKTVG